MNETSMRILEKKDLEVIYPLMEIDFPANELKPRGMIEKSLDSGFMEGYGFYRGEMLLAYAFFVKIEDVLLFDYLAVLPEYRESGVGSEFLQMLREALQSYECVIGEVENPDYCEDSKERSGMERRIRFYNRNGVRDTGASGRVYGVEYRFFEIEGNRIHSPEEAVERINRFYRTYWPDEDNYRKYVKIHG